MEQQRLILQPSQSHSGKDIEMDYPRIPRPLKRPEEPGWPPTIPLPVTPAEDVGRILKQVLERLEGIEKRLDNIEKLLVQMRPSS